MRLLCENASQRPVSYLCGCAGRIPLSSPSPCWDVSTGDVGSARRKHSWDGGELGVDARGNPLAAGRGRPPRARGLEGLEEAQPGGQGGATDPQPRALLPRLTCMLGTKPFLILQQFLLIFSKNCSSSL